MNTSPLLALHRVRGAQLSGATPPFVLCFGEVPDEYRAAQQGAALFDHTDRGQIEVSGADAVDFLQRLLANDVRGLAPGSGCRNLLLSGKGKVLFDFDLARVDDQRLLLSTPPGRATDLLRALDTYHFSEKLVLRDASEEHAPLSMCGARTREVLRQALGVEPAEDHHRRVVAAFHGSVAHVTTLPVAGSPGVRIDVGPQHVEALWDALVAAGAVPAGRIAFDSLRVEAGAAEPGVDIDESVYPQEARLERAFSLEKGCYIGQEVVAKIDTYGGLNKRLVALVVSHDDPVERGTRLWRDDDGEWRDLGVVTSWAYSFVRDSGLCLAYVKRRHQAPGTTFRVGRPDAASAIATVVALPVRSGAVAPTGAFEGAPD